MRGTRVFRVFFAAVALPAVMASCSTSSTSSSPTNQTLSSTVKITRDSSGIPHITAPNFTALGYGEATAFSQDNFCTLAEDFVTVNAQRSKYFGPNNLSLNYSAGAYDTNLNSDFFWQSVKSSKLLSRELHQAPPL